MGQTPPLELIAATQAPRNPSVRGAGNWPAFISKAYNGLAEAGVLSGRAWARHPFRTALRMVPLGLKERVNQAAHRPVFDLSFYLQFQPSSLEHTGVRVTRIAQDLPSLGNRRRVAFLTPHLGPGGAENVLLDMARSLDRNLNEIFLIATHSRDDRLAHIWKQHADRVFDLSRLAEPEARPSALYSLILNWQMDTVVLQNTLFAYSVLPHCKRELPGLRAIDLIHTVGTDWDIAAATATVAGELDTRIVISEAARRHLIALGTGERKIRLIRNGVDLHHFQPVSMPTGKVFRILFAARLDPVKRPLLLVDIARALVGMQPEGAFRFVVAGDGPEAGALLRSIRSAGVEHLFELHGYVEELAPLLAESAVVLVTSSNEGVPLTILEAFATARPVIASNAGAIQEILDATTGMLIEARGGEAGRFAQALFLLMNDPDRRYRMGVEARRRAEMSYDRCHSLQLYRDVLTPCARS